jgi:hypothetical protein
MVELFKIPWSYNRHDSKQSLNGNTYVMCFLIFLVLICSDPGLLCPSAVAQDAAAFELFPGVIVDINRGLAYVMNTDGGIDAVNLQNGSTTWSTTAAEKPLALVNERLICQAPSTQPTAELKIVILDVTQNGSVITSASISLPSGVHVAIDQTLTSTFTTRAGIVDGDVFLSWEYMHQPVQGVPPPDLQSVKKKELPAEPIMRRSEKGTLRINPSSGRMSVLSDTETGLAPSIKAVPDIPAAERLKDLPQPQFLSADAAHIMVSIAVADNNTWNRYRWTIYDRASAEKVAETDNHLSFAPFFITGNRLIYITNPYSRRTEKGLIDEPLKLRCLNMQDGSELWSKPVRDTAYRGPFPP